MIVKKNFVTVKWTALQKIVSVHCLKYSKKGFLPGIQYKKFLQWGTSKAFSNS